MYQSFFSKARRVDPDPIEPGSKKCWTQPALLFRVIKKLASRYILTLTSLTNLKSVVSIQLSIAQHILITLGVMLELLTITHFQL